MPWHILSTYHTHSPWSFFELQASFLRWSFPSAAEGAGIFKRPVWERERRSLKALESGPVSSRICNNANLVDICIETCFETVHKRVFHWTCKSSDRLIRLDVDWIGSAEKYKVHYPTTQVRTHLAKAHDIFSWLFLLAPGGAKIKLRTQDAWFIYSLVIYGNNMII